MVPSSLSARTTLGGGAAPTGRGNNHLLLLPPWTVRTERRGRSWSDIPRGGDDAEDAAGTTTAEASTEKEVEDTVLDTPPPPPPAVSTTSDEGTDYTSKVDEEEGGGLSLDERVHRAMKRLGLVSPTEGDDAGAAGDNTGGSEGAAAAVGEEEGSVDVDVSADVAPSSSSPPAGVECKDGVCAPITEGDESVPATLSALENDVVAVAEGVTGSASVEEDEEDSIPPPPVENDETVAEMLSEEFKVSKPVALASLAASKGSVEGARQILQYELEMTSMVPPDCDELKTLLSDEEGWEESDAKRALALTELNVEDARAILMAEREDEREATKDMVVEDEQQEEEEELKTVDVSMPANFDPVASLSTPAAPPSRPAVPAMGAVGGSQPQQQQTQEPTPANPADVIFDVTAETLHELVIASPVPVVLDVYADWCGPCKALTPALEQMAIKGGGVFRLCKLNSDNERSISQLLGITGLPTVFGIRPQGGQIHSRFTGMPSSEGQLKNFFMSLVMGTPPTDPPLTSAEKESFAELSTKLFNVAGKASYSFASRERLENYVTTKLEELVKARDDDMSSADESATMLQGLLSNVIDHPTDMKYRTVKLDHPVIHARVGQFAACRAILKSAGFVPEAGTASDGKSSSKVVVGGGKKVINVAPLSIAKDAIRKWSDVNRYNIAKAARKRKDEEDRAELLRREAEEAARRAELGLDDDDEDEDEDDVDPNACSIKMRLDGKKKVHEVDFDAEEPVGPAILSTLSSLTEVGEGSTVQITCASKRLVLKSDDAAAMSKTFRDHGLAPAASLVVKVVVVTDDEEEGDPAGDGDGGDGGSKKGAGRISLAERAAEKRKKKGRSATMQSIGIYAKDDNAKGELIDGGGGVMYEHDVTDSEDEGEQDEGGADEDAAPTKKDGKSKKKTMGGK